MMPSPVVEFRNVSFSYGGPVVLEDVAFSIESGDFVAVVGPNGGGKTTIIKLMLGLLTPQQGTIRLFGQNPKQSRPLVGYSPQFLSVDFCFPLTVFDVVLMGRIKPAWNPAALWYSKEDRNAAREAIRIMQLEKFIDAPFGGLSGGQRQRVLIARCICGKPKLLLLDEPTNNIDISSEQILSQILTELNQTMTVVMVSHDVGFVEECVKKVICVNRSAAIHSVSELGDNQTINSLYGHTGMKLVVHGHR